MKLPLVEDTVILNKSIAKGLRKQGYAVDCAFDGGPICVDTAAHQASVNGQAVTLTNKEYGILEYLMYWTGTIVSAEELIEHVWGSDADLFSNAFKVHLHTLKKSWMPPGKPAV